MAVPAYKSAAASSTSIFGGLKAAAARELNKARARFWTAATDVLESVDEKIAQPALKTRNAVVDTVTTAGKNVLGGLKIGTVLLVLAAGVVLFLYLRPFLPNRK